MVLSTVIYSEKCIEKGENSNRTDRDGGVIIRPLIYDTILIGIPLDPN